jgi:CHAD domain-containing protein
MWDRERSEELRSELKWLADQLGPVRDGQVMARRLSDAVHAEPIELIMGPVAARIHETLTSDTTRAHAALLETLAGKRYLRLVEDLDAFVDAPGPDGVGARWVRKRVRRAVWRADRLLDEATMTDPSANGHDRDARLHEARKAYKRARYAIEAYKPAVGKPAGRLAKLLGDLQDVLGAHQDAVIMGQVLRQQGLVAYQSGENAFSYGLLHARQHAAGEAALDDLNKNARRARRGKVRSWLVT